MTARRLTWLLAFLLAIPLCLLGAAGLIAGTDSGTRWLLARATPYLPPALTIGELRGNLLAGVTVSRVRWQDEAVDVRAEAVYADVELLPLIDREVRVAALTIGRIDVQVAERAAPDDTPKEPFELRLPIDLVFEQFESGPLRLRVGEFDRTIDSIRTTASLRGIVLYVGSLEVEADWIGLSASGDGRLGRRYAIDGEATWRYDAIPDLSLAGRIEVDGDAGGYVLTHELAAPYAVTTTGVVSTADELAADLEHRWTSITRVIGEQTLVLDDGFLRTRGGLERVALELRAELGLDERRAAIDAVGDVTREGLIVDGLVLDGEEGRIEAAGRVDWTDVLEITAEFDATRLDPAEALDYLEGSVGATGRVTARFPEESIEGDLEIDALSGKLMALPLGGTAGIRISGQRVSVDALDVTLGQSRLKGSGVIDERLDLDVELDVEALSEIDERLGGAVSATASIGGEPAAPSVTANVDLSAAAFNDLRAATGSAAFELAENGRVNADLRLGDVDAAGVTVATLTANVTGDRAALALAENGQVNANVQMADVEVAGIAIANVTANLTGDRDAHRLTVSAEADRGQLMTELLGAADAERWTGSLERFEATSPALLGRWSLEDAAAMSAAPERFELGRLCLSNEATGGRGCLSGQTGGGSTDVDLALADLPLAALPVTLPAGAELEGFLAVNLNAAIRDRRVNGRGEVSLSDAVITATYEDEPYALEFTTARMQAEVVDNRLTANGAIDANDGEGQLEFRVEADDVLRADSPLTGDGRLAVPDVSILAVFAPVLSAPVGELDGALTVAGTLAAPAFAGEVTLADGAFGVRPVGIRVTDVALSLSQAEPGRLGLEGSAASGEGSIRIRGGTELGLETGLRAELAVTGSDFELARLPDWRVSASPDVRLVLDEEQAAVTGRLDVPVADVTLNSIPQSAERPSGDVTVHGVETAPEKEPGRRISLDVTAAAGENVRFAGFGLTTGITGEVRLRGGSDRPLTGNGTLSLKDGRYEAYGQDLEIESGDLIFNGPLDNPQLAVRAVRRIETDDIVAGIQISGTPRRLRSEVYSDPPLGDAEALSYLLTGRPLSRSGDEEGDSDLLNQAAFALGLSRAGSIASQIQGDLGLDTLAVEGGADSGRIVAGKRLGERLLVEYGYGLVDKIGTLLLRYQINSRLVLESRTGATSELDLVYSVRKR